MPDAVVIGSGPNGLAAAIRLAEAGRSVTVLEAADTPGGAVKTEELTLPGFRHDVMSAVHPAGAASPVFGRMPLDRFGLEWVEPEACSAQPVGGDRGAALYRDLDATAESLNRLNPGDGDAWVRFARPFADNWDAVRDTVLGSFPPVGGALRLLLGTGPLNGLRFTRLLSGSATALARRMFGDGGSRAWLYGAVMHGDTPPDKAGSAMAGFYLNLLGHAVGWPSPRGGAGNLTSALVGYLESLGGSVVTGARVERIMSSDGHVTGVGVAGGDSVDADVVVADVMPRALAAMGGDSLSGWYRTMLKRYRYGPATLKLDWALDGPIPWSSPEARKAGTVHVGGGEEEFLASVKGAEHGLPERPFMLLGQQTIADPTRAPAGKHTAWAYTHGPAEGVDWQAATGPHAERMEAQIERFAPGFRDLILARHVLAPADLEKRNANLIMGDVGGGSYKLNQVVFRPVPSLNPYATPLDGLYIGSAAAFPGGAVHGVPGDAAAKSALKRSA